MIRLPPRSTLSSSSAASDVYKRQLLGQLGGAPVGGLLQLGQLDPEQFPAEVLETVPVGIGPGELRGDLGAIDGARHDAEKLLEHGDIETAEMKDFEHALVGEQPLQLRGVVVPGHLNQGGAAVAIGQLDKAEPIAMWIEPERLGVDGDRLGREAAFWQVALMKLDGRRLAQGLNRHG